MTLEEKTAKEIADILNKEKIPTPSEYLKIRGLENRTRGIWTRSIIGRILRNETYTGKCLRGKSQNINYKSKKRVYIRRDNQIITENTHEAIIPTEIYDKVHNNNKYGSTIVKHEEINTKFLKHMYCGCCNNKMTKRRSREHLKIHCYLKEETDLFCSNKRLYEYNILEKLILKNIRENFEIFFKGKNSNSSLIKKYIVKKVNEKKEIIKEYKKELSIISFKISKLYSNRLMDKISEEQYKNEYFELTEKRKQINNMQEKLKLEVDKINNEGKILEKYKKAKNFIKKLEENILTSEEIEELIDKILIDKNTIHIYYKFGDMKSNIKYNN